MKLDSSRIRPRQRVFSGSWAEACEAAKVGQKCVMVVIEDEENVLLKDPAAAAAIRERFIVFKCSTLEHEERLRTYLNKYFVASTVPHISIFDPVTDTVKSSWAGTPQPSVFLQHLRLLQASPDKYYGPRRQSTPSPASRGPYVPRSTSQRRRCERLCPWKSVARTYSGQALRAAEITEPGFQSEGDSLTSLYKPLKVYQTRVIELAPGGNDAPLDCRLRTVDLLDMEGVRDAETGDVLQYRALSYSWGYGSGKARVLCNGVVVEINANLAEALNHLRSSVEAVVFWCDALCINQSDQLEKAAQVRNMMRIFEKARLVVAWLGPEENDTALLFETLDRADLFEAGSEELLHDHDCLDGYSKFHSALEAHSGRAWFRRVWVRQEVFAARSLFLKCGRYQVPFQKFLRGLRGVSGEVDVLQRQRIQAKSAQSFQIEERTVACAWPGTVAILARDYQHTGTDSKRMRRPSSVLRYSVRWLRVLDEGALFDVTYDIDRVYGGLGIMTSRSNSFFVDEHAGIILDNFPVDYGKSFSQVAQDVVKYLINTDQNLTALGIFAARPSHPSHFPKSLPSWVVDWREQAERSFVQSPPSAHLNAASEFDQPVQDYREDGILRLKGWRVSTLHIIRIPGTSFKSELAPSWRTYMDANFINVLDAHYVIGQAADVMDKDGRTICFVVPAVAMLGDSIVGFNGSTKLYLIRESHAKGKFYFLGPSPYLGEAPEVTRPGAVEEFLLI